VNTIRTRVLPTRSTSLFGARAVRPRQVANHLLLRWPAALGIQFDEKHEIRRVRRERRRCPTDGDANVKRVAIGQNSRSLNSRPGTKTFTTGSSNGSWVRFTRYILRYPASAKPLMTNR
jgi:hypothetical protein